MHFGQASTPKTLTTIFSLLFFLSVFLFSCKDKDQNPAIEFKSPGQGQELKRGEAVNLELDVPAGSNVNSITYLVDGKEVGSTQDTAPFQLKTDSLGLGYRLVTAVVDHDGGKDTLTMNIVVKSALKPSLYSYKVVNAYPHDTAAYTQGLEYHNGLFLESTGQNGASTLRWVDPKSGKVIQKVGLDEKYFGEGASLVGDKVVMLTWENYEGLVFDAKTFKQLGTFPYQNSREGWGLAFDGKHLIKSDGTNRLWFLNKDTYKEEGVIEVYDDQGQVVQLNELEYVDGKIYANIYQSDKIAIIDPKSGAVLSYIDLSGILPAQDRYPNTDVLNGIAWDAKGKRLFVTGKKFSKLFEITLVPQ
ncbi:glutaminyl-peptide cyclotransferase [Pedobacter sp.]|uniref:glutaminyl-peptide cyclotransferase n=1 Tax=Pedobacter sp. TaxID=1411316 RepID=UPI003D7F5DBB